MLAPAVSRPKQGVVPGTAREGPPGAVRTLPLTAYAGRKPVPGRWRRVAGPYLLRTACWFGMVLLRQQDSLLVTAVGRTASAEGVVAAFHSGGTSNGIHEATVRTDITTSTPGSIAGKGCLDFVILHMPMDPRPWATCVLGVLYDGVLSG